MSYLDKFVELAGAERPRRVRTQAGSEKYDAPIGADIKADPAGQKIRANGLKPGQQVKTAKGFQTIGVTREDRVRKGVIHVFGTDGKLLLTIQSNAPVDIKVRIPEVDQVHKTAEDQAELSHVLKLAAVKTAAGAAKHGTPVGSKISKEKTPLKAVNKTIQKAVTQQRKDAPNMVRHGRPTFTRKGWHEELSKHIKTAYPGVSMSLRQSPAGHVTVDAIKVDRNYRGRGLANKAMRDLVDLADHMGVHLSLNPSDDADTDKGRMSKWYSAWGFVSNAGKNKNDTITEAFHRAPRVKEQSHESD